MAKFHTSDSLKTSGTYTTAGDWYSFNQQHKATTMAQVGDRSKKKKKKKKRVVRTSY